MQPVVGRYISGQTQAAENILRYLCHERCMLGVMVQRVARGEPFDDQAPGFVQQGGNFRFARTESTLEGCRQPLTQFVCQQRGRVEHANPRRTGEPITGPCAARSLLARRCWATASERRKPSADPDGVSNLLQVPAMAVRVLLASLTFAATAVAQQSAPPPLVQPAPAADAQTEQVAPVVVPAQQVAPVELTGLLGHAVVGATGSELGRIVDLLADGQGRVRGVVVDVGGFMGLGNRKVAVAWSALRFAAGDKGPVISIVIPPDRIKSWADYIPGRPVAILGAPDSGQ